MADITKIVANEVFVTWNCYCLFKCRSVNINTVAVTYKKECNCFGRRRKSFKLTFNYIENAEEFAEAVRRQLQMAALGNIP